MSSASSYPPYALGSALGANHEADKLANFVFGERVSLLIGKMPVQDIIAFIDRETAERAALGSVTSGSSLPASAQTAPGDPASNRGAGRLFATEIYGPSALWLAFDCAP